MSVYAHGDDWGFVVTIPSSDQRRRQLRRVGFATKGAAAKAERDALTQMAVDGPVPAQRQTTKSARCGLSVEQWVTTRWFPKLEHDLADALRRETTVRCYQHQVNTYVLPGLGQLPFDTLDADQLEAFFADLRTRPCKNKATPLSATTRRQIHKIVRVMLSDAVKMRDRGTNPIGSVERPRSDTQERPVYTEQQAQFLLSALRGERDWALWYLELTTGLRRAELAGLQWPNIDLSNQTVTILNTRTVAGDNVVVQGGPKTKHGRRSLAIDDGTTAALREHHRLQTDERLCRLSSGLEWTDTGYVFVREDGLPYHPQTFCARLHSIQKRLGLPRVNLHDLRHTSATLLLQANVHPQVVQRRLGHSSIQITLDLYSHRVPGMDERAADAIGELVRPEDELKRRRKSS